MEVIMYVHIDDHYLVCVDLFLTYLACSLSIILMVAFHSSTLDWMGKVKQSARALDMDKAVSQGPQHGQRS